MTLKIKEALAVKMQMFHFTAQFLNILAEWQWEVRFTCNVETLSMVVADV